MGNVADVNAQQQKSAYGAGASAVVSAVAPPQPLQLDDAFPVNSKWRDLAMALRQCADLMIETDTRVSLFGGLAACIVYNKPIRHGQDADLLFSRSANDPASVRIVRHLVDIFKRSGERVLVWAPRGPVAMQQHLKMSLVNSRRTVDLVFSPHTYSPPVNESPCIGDFADARIAIRFPALAVWDLPVPQIFARGWPRLKIVNEKQLYTFCTGNLSRNDYGPAFAYARARKYIERGCAVYEHEVRTSCVLNNDMYTGCVMGLGVPSGASVLCCLCGRPDTPDRPTDKIYTMLGSSFATSDVRYVVLQCVFTPCSDYTYVQEYQRRTEQPLLPTTAHLCNEIVCVCRHCDNAI